ncbi:hypothetical protein [Prochlorococcus marinus]|uniref:Uncharacterized protein n=1 Tax=Prochlorococcus marinus (strain MIT 9211) TaxID=93059 RepID=A9BEE0_PROM4|nr:hypothetical protein [Prochlorococcus marinus]ABX08450.1 Hypothetical protein P9211_05191 [Prochlorococcus marinus str. MIT 9211]
MKGPFSPHKISRRYPILAGFHRGIDGGLVGVLLCTALMSALALHSQYLWTISFSRLEHTRELTYKLEESIANLERYLLHSIVLPKIMVKTTSADLIYLDAPRADSRSNTNISTSDNYYNLSHYPITHGY